MKIRTTRIGLMLFAVLNSVPAAEALPQWLERPRRETSAVNAPPQYSVYESSLLGGYTYGGSGARPTLVGRRESAGTSILNSGSACKLKLPQERNYDTNFLIFSAAMSTSGSIPSLPIAVPSGVKHSGHTSQSSSSWLASTVETTTSTQSALKTAPLHHNTSSMSLNGFPASIISPPPLSPPPYYTTSTSFPSGTGISHLNSSRIARLATHVPYFPNSTTLSSVSIVSDTAKTSSIGASTPLYPLSNETSSFGGLSNTEVRIIAL